jgi:hypothetical protein
MDSELRSALSLLCHAATPSEMNGRMGRQKDGCRLPSGTPRHHADSLLNLLSPQEEKAGMRGHTLLEQIPLPL